MEEKLKKQIQIFLEMLLAKGHNTFRGGCRWDDYGEIIDIIFEILNNGWDYDDIVDHTKEDPELLLQCNNKYIPNRYNCVDVETVIRYLLREIKKDV